MNNDELDLELDKILPLLITTEDEDPVWDEELAALLGEDFSADADMEEEELALIDVEAQEAPMTDDEIEFAPQETVPEEVFVSDDPAMEQSIVFSAMPELVQEETASVDQPKKKKSNSGLVYLHDLVYFLAALLISTIFFRVMVVSGDSMYNTLVDGDYLFLVSNVLYHHPQQGDVIVISKESFRNGESIVKRVIATEGQEVDIDFENGIVYVDGEALDEPYVYTSTTHSEGMSFPLIVEEGCLFVMGDNRAMSLDSRNPAIGMVDCREVVGKAVFLIFPGNDSGSMERQYYRIGAID